MLRIAAMVVMEIMAAASRVTAMLPIALHQPATMTRHSIDTQR